MLPFQTAPFATAAFERALWFRSEQFDHASDLPPEYNGGNQRYGADLGMYLSGAFETAGLPCVLVDEDWGWLLMVDAGNDIRLEVSIYNLDDQGEPTDAGAPFWGLAYCAFQRRLVLGFLPWTTPCEVPAATEQCLLDAVSLLEVNFSAWTQGLPGTDPGK